MYFEELASTGFLMEILKACCAACVTIFLNLRSYFLFLPQPVGHKHGTK